MADRMKLTVKTVESVKEVGEKGAKKLQFIATTPANGDWTFFTFTQRFFEKIKVGAVIDADVEIEEKGQYVNRKVIQLYEDGKAVSGRGFGGGGFNRGKSPEDRASIEAQVAARIGADLLVAKIIDDKSALGKATIDWAYKHLCAAPAPRATAAEVNAIFGEPEAPRSSVEAARISGKPIDIRDTMRVKGWTDEDVLNWLRGEPLKLQISTGAKLDPMVKGLTPEMSQKLIEKLLSLPDKK